MPIQYCHMHVVRHASEVLGHTMCSLAMHTSHYLMHYPSKRASVLSSSLWFWESQDPFPDILFPEKIPCSNKPHWRENWKYMYVLIQWFLPGCTPNRTWHVYTRRWCTKYPKQHYLWDPKTAQNSNVHHTYKNV